MPRTKWFRSSDAYLFFHSVQHTCRALVRRLLLVVYHFLRESTVLPRVLDAAVAVAQDSWKTSLVLQGCHLGSTSSRAELPHCLRLQKKGCCRALPSLWRCVIITAATLVNWSLPFSLSVHQRLLWRWGGKTWLSRKAASTRCCMVKPLSSRGSCPRQP